MGQILKVILTDQIPPLSRVAPQLPEDLTDLVDRMLSRDRTRRPRDLREVYNVLRRYADVDAKSFDGAIAPAILPSGPRMPSTASSPSHASSPSAPRSDPYAMTEASTPPPGALESGPISDTLAAGVHAPALSRLPPLERRFMPTTLRQALPPGSNTGEPYEVAPGGWSAGTWRIALVAVVATAATLGGTGLGVWALTHKRVDQPEPPLASASVTPPAPDSRPPPLGVDVTPPAAVVVPAAALSSSATTVATHRPATVLPNPASASSGPSRPHESRPDAGTEHGVFVDKPPF
jgi:hypothetical protein